MGKGTIISGGTGGQYQVQINFDRVRYNAEISKLTDAIADYETKIADKETEITRLEGEYASMVASGYLPAPLAKKQQEIASAQRDRAKLVVILTSFEKRKEYLENTMPDDETVPAWCADLTEDLSGEVGTVEIPGERGVVQIQPGFDGNAEYDGSRDGQLNPVVTQSAAQTFYNLAMLPGWQKWRPTYRYGTITSINGDYADVTLDTALSSQQALDVNQGGTLTDVPIEYMTCNGAAFMEDDSVLIKFEDQDWNTPMIIGFKESPKPCGNKFIIKPMFNGNNAVKGGQHILVAYSFNGETRYLWLQIYGTENPAPDTSGDGYSDVLEFETQDEFDALMDTGVFYLRSKIPNEDGTTLTGVTFAHFYEVDNPTPPYDYTDHAYADKTHYTYQVGTGDGTTSPTMGTVPYPPYGFSIYPSDYIILRTTGVNGNELTAYLDFDGFLVAGDASGGHLNVLTGIWDTPMLWDAPVKIGAVITMDYYARGYADTLYYLDLGGNDAKFMRQVSFKRSENNMYSAQKSYVTFGGDTVTAYEIEFSGLKIMRRTPNETAQENRTCGCVNGQFSPDVNLCSTLAANTAYGAIPEGLYNYVMSVNIGAGETHDSITTRNNVDPDLYCYYEYNYVTTNAAPSYEFLGVISDNAGNNPTRPSFHIEQHFWVNFMSIGDDGAGDSGACERPHYDSGMSEDDPFDYIPDNACCIKECRWDFSMVDTPADAF